MMRFRRVMCGLAGILACVPSARAQTAEAGARVPIRFVGALSRRHEKTGATFTAQTLAAIGDSGCVLVPAYASLSGIIEKGAHGQRRFIFKTVATADSVLPLAATLESVEFAHLGVLKGETGTMRLDAPFSVAGCAPGAVRTEVAPPAVPARTATRHGKAGDPVNLIFQGTRAGLDSAFTAAGWTLVARPSFGRITHAVLAALDGRADASDPVSNQYLFGRRQDFAYERAGPNVRIRHHLRLWQVDGTLWAGAASEDVGLLFWRLKEPTHRIDPRVDLERDELARELEAGGCARVQGSTVLPDAATSGKTATGQHFRSDGRALVIALGACRPT